MSESIYLSIETDGFEERKKEGIEESKANSDESTDMSWPNLSWNVDWNDTEFNSDGELYISGAILDTSLQKFGYLSTTVRLNLDTATKIIEFYMKKLGKIKTVLEATK